MKNLSYNILESLMELIKVITPLIIGFMLNNWSSKYKLKNEENKQRDKDKKHAYIQLLSCYQELKDLALGYAHMDKLPTEGKRYEVILNNYGNILDRMRTSVIEAKLYAPKDLSKDIDFMYNFMYKDFLSYLYFQDSKLSNDHDKEDSRLRTIINKMKDIEEKIVADLNLHC